ncbi:MAG: hypothetical protein AB9835_14460 [Eubacteriales bacterium]
MRSIAEIEADIANVKANLPAGYMNTDLCELEAELRNVILWDIPTDELEQYAQARGEGRVVVLPVKLGDTVWVVNESGCIDELEVKYIQTARDGSLCCQAECKNETEDCYCGSDSVCAVRFTAGNMAQRKIYLSREAAKNALGGGEK